jgi:DNA-binding NtrC family response regulator
MLSPDVLNTFAVAQSPPSVMTVLSVSPSQDDHDVLGRMFDPRWSLYKALTLSAGLTALRDKRIALVLCESNLQPGTWLDMLEKLEVSPGAPDLIVTSRLADEHLWAEVLNRGAYDVLAKPFDAEEVGRIIGQALQRRQSKPELN